MNISFLGWLYPYTLEVFLKKSTLEPARFRTKDSLTLLILISAEGIYCNKNAFLKLIPRVHIHVSLDSTVKYSTAHPVGAVVYHLR